MAKKNYLYEDSYKGVTFWKIAYTMCGSPRYVIHFLDLIGDKENNMFDNLDDVYKTARKRAGLLGGCVYRAKWFEGGFVFKSYDIRQTIESIVKMRGE